MTRNYAVLGLLGVLATIGAATGDAGDYTETRLVASDASDLDAFGYSLSMSGETLVVGADGLHNNSSHTGRAYVLVRNGANWTEQQRIASPDAVIGSHFGNSVGVSDDTLVVGGDETACVFVRSGTNWTEQQRLTAPAGEFALGGAVAISGNTLVLGAPYDDDNGTQSGAAYVFTRSGTTWSQQQKLIASDGSVADYFGTSLAIDRDTIVVGAPGDFFPSNLSGSAYVFVRSGSTWSEEGKLSNPVPGTGGDFGYSVGISGDSVVVGARGHTGVVHANASGTAYVFVRSDTTWTKQQDLAAADALEFTGNHFGASVGISGDRVVVGAYDDRAAGDFSGAAYLYTRSGETWSEEAKLTASDAGENDRFGWSVCIGGDRVVAGAPNLQTGSGPGATYVYEPSTDPPPPVGTHDLAIVKLKVPKVVTLKGEAGSVTKRVTVEIQNRSPHAETITDLTGLVTLVVESFGTPCPNATVVLRNLERPKTLKPKKKLKVQFDVSFDCAFDPVKSSKENPGHEDFRYRATVHHESIDDLADTHPADDVCPRPALPGGVDPNPDESVRDTGCGGELGDGTRGADVLTDVVVK